MMTRRQANKGLVAGIAAAGLSSRVGAQEKIALPGARTEGGMPLMNALKARHCTREYSNRPLPLHVLCPST
jgi:hypothetical protein